MLFKLGLALLFFLPVIESFNRILSYDLLLTASILISFKFLHDKKIILDKINALWVLMLIAFTISLVYSISIYHSFYEYLRYLAYFLVFISIRSYGNTKRMIHYYYLPMIIVNTVILSFLSILYMIPSFKLLPPVNGMNLFYPSFGHNHLADILIFAIPLSIAVAVGTKNNLISKIFWNMLIFILLIFFMASFGRAAMISFAISVLFYATIKSADRLWHIWGLFIGIAIMGYLAFSFYVSNFNPSAIANFPFMKKIYKPAAKENRFLNYYQAIVSLSRSPLAGMGLKTFRIMTKRIPPASSSWYVHNHYLQILAETGFLGGILFTSLIFMALVQSCRNIKAADDKLIFSSRSAVFIALFATSLQSFLDFNWQYNTIFLLFWVGLAVLMPLKPESLKKKSLAWNIFWYIAAGLFLTALLFSFHNPTNIY